MSVVTPPTPEAAGPGSTNGNGPLVEVDGLVKHFPIKGGLLQRQVASVQAVDDVNFTVTRGETLGLVGESGCGKTTVGRLLLRLIDPTAGTIRFDGQDITRIKGPALKPYRRRMQLIFQDPYSSLDPRSPIGDSIGEGLRIHGIGNSRERADRVKKMMDVVGLQSYHARRYPHEFSGGQRQRIGIARALAVEPSFLVCDEPVSSLDVSVQAQILNLLGDLQRDRGLAYLFIAHDLAVVRQIAHRIAVMYLGTVVESGPAEQVVAAPRHPYTQALVSAVPRPEDTAPPQRIVLAGDPPSPREIPSGCPFVSWCFHPAKDAKCLAERPALRPEGAVLVACHYSGKR